MDENVQQPEEVLSDKESPSAKPDALEVLKGQLAAEKDKYVRLLAEFENMRKRHQREREELIKYAHEEVIIECLKIYEDLERSLNAFKTKQGMDANLVKGLAMVFNNMRELMNTYDVKPIESVGKAFDPHCHEPLIQAESKEFPDGYVMEEFQKGYTLGGKVVRTAKVKVAKNIN
ncbi:MAG: nucleotide exchange factor GrpE [Candidatus Omnitrophica bacterium]|nr:nucleotide exchange factor GrpE [Candidatus Omnitrophota bacterium]